MNRLMVNLRRESDHYREEGPTTTETTLTVGNVFSTRIVGNLTSELIFSGDDRSEMDEYFASRRSIGLSSVSADLSFFTNTQASVPSNALPGPSTYSRSTNVNSTYPRVTWGDGVVSSSNAMPSSQNIASGSRLKEYTLESPSTAVEEYPLQTFSGRCSTSPVSDETCVGSTFDLESKLQEHEDIYWKDLSGKGKGRQRMMLEQHRSRGANDIHEESRQEIGNDENPG